jgi:hypothetical protein
MGSYLPAKRQYAARHGGAPASRFSMSKGPVVVRSRFVLKKRRLKNLSE